MIAFLINPFPYTVLMDLECIGDMANDIRNEDSVLLITSFTWKKVSLNLSIIFKADDERLLDFHP